MSIKTIMTTYKFLILTTALYSLAPLAAQPEPGFFPVTGPQGVNISQVLETTPGINTTTDTIDVAYFWSQRALLLTARGLEAAADDVYTPQDVWLRFSSIIDVQNINPQSLVALLDLMKKVTKDGENFVNPIKKNVDAGGRQRPFMRFIGSPTCLEPIDLVLGHKENDYSHYLKESGSYPSAHAQLGILWAMVLSEVFPEKKLQLYEKGISFGESRAVCGFHYESDIVAGRISGQILFEKLKENSNFKSEIKKIKSQIKK